MAKNFCQEGETLSLVAPSGGVVAGSPIVISNLFGIPNITALEGVFNLPKLSTDTIVAGQKLFWDVTNARITETSATGLYMIGIATEVAGNGITSVPVRLDGIAVTAV